MNPIRKIQQHPRLALLLIAIGCIAALAFAYYLQHDLKQKPCPLCILARYSFSLVAVFALLGSVFGFKAAVRKVSAGLAGIAALAGVGVAGYHNLNKLDPPKEGCGADKIGEFVNKIPFADQWPDYFFAMGSCIDQYPPILGLELPMWTLITFVSLVIALFAISLGSSAARERQMFAGMR
jgi:protein dithiol:quinone oxidoreductase